MEKKKKKRVIVVSGVVLLVVLLAGFGIVTAGGMHRGFHPGFSGKDFHDRDMSGFMLWRLDSGIKELNLSEEQDEEYAELRTKIEAAMSEGKEIKARIKDEVHAEFEKEVPDLELIAETFKGHLSDMHGFIQENLDLFIEFYGALDEEQKAQVVDTIKERMGEVGVS